MGIRMRIDNVKLRTSEEVYNFDLSARCTLLEGPVGTGKSSLLELLKHALGGSAVLTPITRSHVMQVEAAVNLGGNPFVLRRGFGREARYVEVLDPRGKAEFSQVPVKKQPGEMSISDFLLSELGLPSVEIPRARSRSTGASVPLTFNDLFTYLYVEQQEIDRSIVHHTEPFREPKRRAFFELLFGLSDPAQLRAETELGKVRDQIRSTEHRHEAIKNFLVTAEVDEEPVLLERRAVLVATADTAASDLSRLRGDLSEITDSHRQVRNRVQNLQAELERAEAELRSTQAEVRQRESLLAQLHLDLGREDKARSASRRLSPIDFISCPRCLQDLDDARSAANECTLCLQPVVATVSRTMDDDADVEIDQQINETAELLVFARRSAGHAEERVVSLQAQLNVIRLELDAVTAESISPRFEEIEILSGQRARAAAGIEHVDQLLSFHRERSQIDVDLSGLAARRSELEELISSAREQRARRQEIMDDLSELFDQTVKDLRVPWANYASLDSRTYLPLVNGEPFETLAVAGGTKTVVSVAYHLTLLAYALNNNEALLPQFLMIDTPRKNLGSNASDNEIGRRIYERLEALSAAMGDRVQFVVADNDVPARRDWLQVVSFDYDHPLIRHVTHPGEDAVLSGQLQTIGSES